MAAHLFHKHAATSGPGPERQNGFDADDVVEARHGRIVVRFQLENKAIDLPRLLGAVRSVQDHLEEKLAIPPRPVEIEIFSTRREWGAAHTHFDDGDAPSWVEGDSGRVIRIIMAGEDPAAFARLRLMVIHEVIHHAVDALGPTAIPAWLDEGLAICLSQDLPARYAEQLAAAADGDALLPLEALKASFARFDRQLKTLAYAQSASLVGYLIDQHGWDLVKSLLMAENRGQALDAALRPFGLNLYLLEKEWMLDFRRKATKTNLPKATYT